MSPWRRHVPLSGGVPRTTIELHRAGRSTEGLAREFELSSTTISKWIKQAQVDAGERDDGLTSEEHPELRRLRRENKRRKLEREILEKAAAWFAGVAGSPTTGRQLP